MLGWIRHHKKSCKTCSHLISKTPRIHNCQGTGNYFWIVYLHFYVINILGEFKLTENKPIQIRINYISIPTKPSTELVHRVNQAVQHAANNAQYSGEPKIECFRFCSNQFQFRHLVIELRSRVATNGQKPLSVGDASAIALPPVERLTASLQPHRPLGGAACICTGIATGRCNVECTAHISLRYQVATPVVANAWNFMRSNIKQDIKQSSDISARAPSLPPSFSPDPTRSC